MQLNWSPRPSSSTDVLQPVWGVRFPLTYGYEQLARHACVAVPIFQEPVNEMEVFRQIQLVCSFDYVRSARVRAGLETPDPATTFGTYLVRVMGDGRRLPVDLRMHTANFSSSGLLYDVSYNAIYLTTFASASYTGEKRVLRVRLTASYNYEGDVTGVANASSSILHDPGFGASVSFDGAVIEPRSNALFYYVANAQGSALEMHFLPMDPITLADGTTTPLIPGARSAGDRRVKGISVAGSSSSGGMRRLLSGLATAYDLDTPPTFFFGLYGTLYVYDDQAMVVGYREGYRCSTCPAGTTTRLEGARSAEECQCPSQDYYFDFGTSSCRRVSDSCAAGEFIAVEATATSDIVCAKCPSCPRGTYRDVADCQPNRPRSVLAPAKCIACPVCPPGHYINPETCNASSSVAPSGRVGVDCLPCPGCKVGETISGTLCPGTTLWSTQSCQRCTATCPDGTYISSATERCSGTSSRGSPTDPFDPETECVLCGPCTGEQGQARVGGCTGTLRVDPPVCAPCEVCGVGEYITQPCSNATASLTTPRDQRCAACPASCPSPGQYMARPCTGTSLMRPDHVCLPCATCAKGSYIVPCGGGNNSWTWNNNGSQATRPPPEDAGRCAPCRTSCGEGFYLSKQCDGTTTSDVVQCARCDDKCARGLYMHARCPGNTSSPSTNDCRPCQPCARGEYMAYGKCVDGTGATSPLQRACERCTPCAEGEYMASVCSGADVLDVSDCAACEPCPVGTYLAKPCNGSGLSPRDGRVCTPCKMCPRGFYRSRGCGLGLSSLSASTSDYDDVECLPCSPCAAGEYVLEQCSGLGTSPTDRRCVSCASCGIGRYYSSGCRGNETSGNYTCASCTRCPAGTYISGGCGSGRGTVPDPTCTKCAACPAGEYVSVACSGLAFTATSRTCAKCTVGPCPAGYYTAVQCPGPQGNQDRVCRSIATNETLGTAVTTTKATSSSTTTTRAATTTTTTITPKATTAAAATVLATTTTTAGSTPPPPPPPAEDPGGPDWAAIILGSSFGAMALAFAVVLFVKIASR